MTAHRSLRIGLASLVLVSGLGTLRASEPYRTEKAAVTVTCPLTIGGSFEARTTALTGEVTVDPGSADGVRGSWSADLRQIGTGIALRDRHLRQNYLEVDKGPEFAVATLDQIRIDNWNGSGPFRGVMRLHGQQREIAGTATVAKDGRGFLVEAKFPLKISDFQIPEPVYLGVGVRDSVEIRVKMSVAPAPVVQTQASR